MSEQNDDIGKILAEFQNQKQKRETLEQSPSSENKIKGEKIDFAKNDEDAPKEKKALKKKVKKEKPKKEKKKAKLKKPDFKKLFNKRFFIALGVIALAAAATAAIVFAVNESKTAYLKPYEEKYPDVEFPVGIMEKYCDIYAENKNADSFIEISDLSFKSLVSSKKNETLPYREQSFSNAQTFNYVVYMQDSKIEELYKDADSYNASSGFISYSDFFNEYTFKVVGAFYTNTNEADDGGYIFPYNVTEVMTDKSYSDFIDRLDARFIYDTGVTITRNDTLLTLSCPTDYREDYRFVVVGVMRDNPDNKPTAKEKEKIRLQQAIYDENNQENPYKYSAQWYPEIIVTDKDGNKKTIQQTIEDYK
ncbi:MAG: hypothetical protein ACI4IQ_04910 [Eubacterium sp.]